MVIIYLCTIINLLIKEVYHDQTLRIPKRRRSVGTAGYAAARLFRTHPRVLHPLRETSGPALPQTAGPNLRGGITPVFSPRQKRQEMETGNRHHFINLRHQILLHPNPRPSVGDLRPRPTTNRTSAPGYPHPG